mgnify:CR=1 FL=1
MGQMGYLIVRLYICINWLSDELLRKTSRISELESIVALLRQEVSDQKTQIEQLGVKKDSGNSSLPPSGDIRKGKSRSLRVKTGRKSGGQKGHKGYYLQRQEKADEIIEHFPPVCTACGQDLSNVASKLIGSRQVIEIPPISPKYIEHQQYSRTCSCGHCQKAAYPSTITAPIQYGKSVSAMIAYLNVRQMIPYQRLSETMEHLFGLKISEGTINNLLTNLSEKARPVYDKIKEMVSLSEEVGSDETSCKVNGKKWWIWIWQTLTLTFISPQPSRGKVVVTALFPDGFQNACLTSDRYATHLGTVAKAHQLCLVHLQRDIKYLIALEKRQWAIDFQQWLADVIAIKKTNKSAYSKDDPLTIAIEKRLTDLVSTQIDKQKYPKTATFCKSMLKNQGILTTFLYYSYVPFHNNRSERGIRNIKVKQKISGQFKSGQEAYAILRSVIDTAIKQGEDIWTVLTNIANLPIPE